MIMLTPQQVSDFIEFGILVVNVLDSEEVCSVRKGFHNYLLSKGCDHNDLESTAASLTNLSSTDGAGGVLDIFYGDFKLSLNENPKIFGMISQLWRATYSSSTKEFFDHPFGEFDDHKAYMYIDRVCYRVPETVSNKFTKGKKKLQRSLTPHLDVCPHLLYDNLNKWKPIQCFVALTDTIDPNMGGFEACPGFHLQFDEWSKSRKPSNNDDGTPPCVGSFTPIRPVEDASVIQMFRHIPCKAGDLVMWDYRIPHANSRYNLSDSPREVVYLGFLPFTDLNRKYAIEQLRRLKNNELPSDQWHNSKSSELCTYGFSELGRQLLLLEKW